MKRHADSCRRQGRKVEFEIIDLPKKRIVRTEDISGKGPRFVKENKEEMAVEYITAVLKAMGAQDFTAEANRDGENLNITLKGDDLGFVIGRRGETIDAIQYLASLAVNRLDGDYMRITIDSGNFREKREKTLESLARRLARNVVKSGRSMTLEPMNPYERRIIHATVATVEVRPLPPSEKSRTDGWLSAPPIRSKKVQQQLQGQEKSLTTTEKAATARTPAVRRAKERTRTVRKRNRMCSVRTTTARTKAERAADVRQDRTPITRERCFEESRRYPTRISAVRYRAALLQVRLRTSRCTQKIDLE